MIDRIYPCSFPALCALVLGILLSAPPALAQEEEESAPPPTGMTLPELERTLATATNLIEVYTGRTLEDELTIELIEDDAEGDAIEIDLASNTLRARPAALEARLSTMQAPSDVHQFIAQLLLVDAFARAVAQETIEDADAIDETLLHCHAALTRGRIARRYGLTAADWYCARVLTEERGRPIPVMPYRALERIYRLQGDAGLWSTLESGGLTDERISELVRAEDAHKAAFSLEEPFTEPRARLTDFGWEFQEVTVPGQRLRSSFNRADPKAQELVLAGLRQLKFLLAQSEAELTRINIGVYELDSAQLAPVLIEATHARLDKDNDSLRQAPLMTVSDITRGRYEGAGCDASALYRYSTEVKDGPTAQFVVAQCARDNIVVEVTIQAEEPDESMLAEMIDATWRSILPAEE